MKQNKMACHDLWGYDTRKWRVCAYNTALWYLYSAAFQMKFRGKIATFAKPENVIGKPGKHKPF
jgi:hypothetical protein